MATKLNPKQELFCRMYTTQSEFFGNATRAYMEAYVIEDDGKGNSSTRTDANRLLTNAHVASRVNELLRELFNDETVDGELSYIMNQRDELSPKLAAIKEYNALKSRITAKLDVVSGGEPITALVRFMDDPTTSSNS